MMNLHSTTSEEDLQKVASNLKTTLEYAATLSDDQRTLYSKGFSEGFGHGALVTMLDPEAYLVYCRLIRANPNDYDMKVLVPYVEARTGTEIEWENIYEWYANLQKKQPWWKFWK